MTSDALHDEGAALIRQAFERAKNAGREDWQTMTTAVLKNRLLDVTGREFHELRWGVESFRGFVDQFSDVVEVLPGPGLAAVRLIEGEGEARDPGATERQTVPELGSDRKIRPDLWSAILDYTSGARYGWNGLEAVRIPPGEENDPAADRLLPTLTEKEFKDWRSEFVNEQSQADAGVATLLYRWLERGEPLAVLPKPLRIAWVVELKRRVLARLIEWFDGEGISRPVDIVEVVREVSSEGDPGPDRLRARLIAAIGRMSDAELAQVTIPATALLRDD